MKGVSQHLWDLSGKLHPSDVAAKRRWVMSHQHFLDDGKIEPLVNRLRALGTERQELERRPAVRPSCRVVCWTSSGFDRGRHGISGRAPWRGPSL